MLAIAISILPGLGFGERHDMAGNGDEAGFGRRVQHLAGLIAAGLATITG